MSPRKPVIAIIGRPNVGKSTLVNRIVGSRRAIVDDLPGVTRDRSYYDAEWLGKQFKLIDTGGLVPDEDKVGTDDRFTTLINQQVFIALQEADSILFVVDGQAGILPDDEAIAHTLRKSNKPVFLAVNKIDRPALFPQVNEFYRLGFDEPMPLSAMHGNVGVGNLLDALFSKMDITTKQVEEDVIRMCILGRPNVGKSSMLNALVGENRTIVSEVSGTTRDAINVRFEYPVADKEQIFEIVDTAGIRKKGKVDYGVELFSVDRALRAMKESDVAVVVMDATESLHNPIKEFVTDQDKKIIEAIVEEGRALIIAVNKWDAVTEKNTKTVEEFKKILFTECPHARFAPVLFTSAKTGQRLPKLLEEVSTVYQNWSRRHKTSLVNQVLLEAIMLSPPHRVKSKLLKVYYATQVSVSPPAFVLFVNDAKLLKDAYKRYLEKKLRESFELAGSPIVLIARNRSEPRH